MYACRYSDTWLFKYEIRFIAVSTNAITAVEWFFINLLILFILAGFKRKKKITMNNCNWAMNDSDSKLKQYIKSK